MSQKVDQEQIKQTIETIRKIEEETGIAFEVNAEEFGNTLLQIDADIQSVIEANMKTFIGSYRETGQALALEGLMLAVLGARLIDLGNKSKHVGTMGVSVISTLNKENKSNG